MCSRLLIVTFFSLYVLFMASANISFYAAMGREVFWGKVKGLLGDSLPGKTRLLGTIGFFIVAGFIMAGSCSAAPYLYHSTEVFASVWSSTFSHLTSFCCPGKAGARPKVSDQEAHYEHLAMDYTDDDNKSDGGEGPATPNILTERKKPSWLKRLIVIGISSEAILLWLVRPSRPGYRILSATLPAAPFIRAHSPFEGLEYLPGDFSWLGNRTTLDTPPVFDWLPADEPLDGFGDWYSFDLNEKHERVTKDHPSLHYNPAKDPLHVSNLRNDILEPVKKALQSGEVKIKHIFLVKLESNRQDFFPLRADSYIRQLAKESYRDGNVPKEIDDRLSNITRTAESLSGSETGFYEDKDRPAPYGGITATNAFTTGTYTLKSVTGSVCGVVTLPINFNREFLYHIYQPCLPQILEALNQRSNTTNDSNDWTSWPWHTLFLQSVSGYYDQIMQLMPALGYKDLISQETIAEPGSVFIPEAWQRVPHRGYMDKALEKHLEKVIADAKKNSTRLFLGHVTAATHRPWKIPGYKFENFFGNRWFALNDRMNKQLNTLAYQDEYLADVLRILKNTGIANETLLVLVGDQYVMRTRLFPELFLLFLLLISTLQRYCAARRHWVDSLREPPREKLSCAFGVLPSQASPC